MRRHLPVDSLRNLTQFPALYHKILRQELLTLYPHSPPNFSKTYTEKKVFLYQQNHLLKQG